MALEQKDYYITGNQLPLSDSQWPTLDCRKRAILKIGHVYSSQAFKDSLGLQNSNTALSEVFSAQIPLFTVTGYGI